LLQHTCQVLMPCLEEEIGRGVEFLDVHSFLFFLFLSFFFHFYISMPYSERMVWTSIYPLLVWRGMWWNRL
jgi:hypothetical protein